MQVSSDIPPIAKGRSKKTLPKHKQTRELRWMEAKRELRRRVTEDSGMVFDEEVIEILQL